MSDDFLFWEILIPKPTCWQRCENSKVGKGKDRDAEERRQASTLHYYP